MYCEKMATKPPQKRLRLNPTHRWTEKQTDCLLNAVILELQEHPESFEKPTARRFYEKIKWQNPIFSGLEWPTMKTRMRHLRNSYNTTLCKQDPDYEDKDLDGAQKKSCLFFDQLHEISNLIQTNVNDPHEDSKLRINKVTEKANWDEDSQSSSSPKMDSPMSRPTPPTSTTNQAPVLKRKQDSIAVLVQVQESRMRKDEELAKLKIEADDKRWQEQMELEREKLQMKKYEIDSNERVALAKLKLEKEEVQLRIEMEERVKKYELDIKQQNMMQI